MLSDASRRLYSSGADAAPPESAEQPEPKQGTPLDQWLEKVDTRKMTLKEYKKFLALQQGQGDEN